MAIKQIHYLIEVCSLDLFLADERAVDFFQTKLNVKNNSSETHATACGPEKVFVCLRSTKNGFTCSCEHRHGNNVSGKRPIHMMILPMHVRRDSTSDCDKFRARGN